jgi:hypothetical protein
LEASNVLLDRTVREVTRGKVYALQPDATRREIDRMTEEQVRDAAVKGMTRPQPGETSQASRLLMNPCLTVQWLALFETLGLPKGMRVFEPCSGASEPVLFATEIYTEGRGAYTTVNLNRPLAAQFREKIGKVTLPVRSIEDDATRADLSREAGTYDVAAFHHAINDLLQTAVSEPRGMDTRTVDWWPNERQMIEWLAEEDRDGVLDERARPALLGAVRNAAELVKPGGWLLFDHWTWLAHKEMDWFPWELFCRLIPLARGWMHEAGFPLEEVRLDGYDPQWWMFWKRA